MIKTPHLPPVNRDPVGGMRHRTQLRPQGNAAETEDLRGPVLVAAGFLESPREHQPVKVIFRPPVHVGLASGHGGVDELAQAQPIQVRRRDRFAVRFGRTVLMQFGGQELGQDRGPGRGDQALRE